MSDTFNLEEFLKTYKDDLGPVEAGVRGALQGASLGYADELSGLAESTFTDKSYEQARDESRKAFKTSEAAYPKTYTAGQIGGGVATSFIPGMGQINAAKMAALGALQGLGNSEETSLTGMGKDAAISGAVGGSLGYLGNKLIGKLPKKVTSSMDDVLTFQDPDFGAVDLTTDQLGKMRTANIKGDLPVTLDDLDPQIGKRFQDFIDNSKGKMVNLKHPDLGNIEAKLSPSGKILSAGAQGDLHISPQEMGDLLPNLQAMADDLAKNSKSPQYREKVLEILQRAASKGPQSLASTNYLLKKDQKGK